MQYSDQGLERLLDDPESDLAERKEAWAGDALYCLATVKHFRSLVPMAQEARKPIFALTPADGAIGSHAAAVQDAYRDFEMLARKIMEKLKAAEKPANTKAALL